MGAVNDGLKHLQVVFVKCTELDGFFKMTFGD